MAMGICNLRFLTFSLCWTLSESSPFSLVATSSTHPTDSEILEVSVHQARAAPPEKNSSSPHEPTTDTLAPVTAKTSLIQHLFRSISLKSMLFYNACLALLVLLVFILYKWLLALPLPPPFSNVFRCLYTGPIPIPHGVSQLAKTQHDEKIPDRAVGTA